MTDDDDTPTVFTAEHLRQARLMLGATQAEMARSMQLPLRTYEDLEAGRTKVRGIHQEALVGAAMMQAVLRAGEVEMPHWIESRIDNYQKAMQLKERRASS